MNVRSCRLLAALIAVLGLVRCAQSDPSATVGVNYGPNLVENPSFETPDSKGDYPLRWKPRRPPPGAKFDLTWQNGDTPFGKKCMRLRLRSMDHAQAVGVMDIVPAKLGKVFELDFWYRSDPNGRLYAVASPSWTNGLWWSALNLPANAEWTRYVAYLTPESRGNGKVGIVIDNKSTVPLWIDNVSFRETDIPVQSLRQAIASSDDASGFRAAIEPSDESALFIQPQRQGAVSYNLKCFIPSFISSKQLKAEIRVMHGTVGNTASLGWIDQPPITYAVTEDAPLPADGQIAIQLPITALDIGINTIEAVLHGPTGEVYAKSDLPIQRFSKETLASFTGLDLEHTGVYMREGKPFFPIGMYGIDLVDEHRKGGADTGADAQLNPAALADLKGHAYNVIHSYCFEANSSDALCLKYLEEARKNGYLVMVGMERSLAEEPHPKELAARLKLLATNPALLCFYSDEMVDQRHAPLLEVQTASQLILQIAPQKGWMAFDSPTPQFIPYLHGLVHDVRDLPDAVACHQILGDKPRWSCTVIGQNPIVPTEVLRYRIFKQIVFGARGVFLWWWPWTVQGPDGPEQLHRANQVIDEVGQLAPAFVTGQALPSWMPIIHKSGMVTMLRCANAGKAYLLAVPSLDKSSGSISFRTPAGVSAQVMFESPRALPAERKVELPVTPDHVVIVMFQRKPSND